MIKKKNEKINSYDDVKIKKRHAIPTKVKIVLWSKSAGKCQFENCPEVLNIDKIKKTDNNSAYIAHIYGYAEGSERYDNILSPKLEIDISNLMLLCDGCHRRIDEKGVGEKDYPASVLIEMKRIHEERIELLSSIKPDMNSHIVIYKANIGQHSPIVTYESVRGFLLPTNYPAQNRAIDLSFSGSYFRDKDENFWNIELENLQNHFDRDLLPLINDKTIRHISLFAFAPMPLLIKLGTLIGDKIATSVKQYDRNSGSWSFSNISIQTEYKLLINETDKVDYVALNISLSATINNDRIISVLGNNCSIYTLTIDNPINSFLFNKNQLEDFTIKIREVFNNIKKMHGSNVPLHIFPAMPISIAVELGRYWMPKADMSLIIYDENTVNAGFSKAIEIR